jgi:hypothetical protein
MDSSKSPFIGAKGPNFIYTKEFIIEGHGEATWSALIDRLPAEHQAVWAQTHKLNKAYPFTAFKALVLSFSELTGETSEEKNAELYEYIADRSLHSVFKMFFSMTSPAFVIKNYPTLWKKFFSTGAVTVQIAHKGYAMLNFDLPEIFDDWLPSACRGYSKKAIEMAGGNNLVQKLNTKMRQDNGNWNYFYELNWEE